MSACDFRVPPTLFVGSKSRSYPRRCQGQAPGIPTSNPGAPAWRLLSPAASTGMSHWASPHLGLTGNKRGRISHQDGVKIMLAIGTDHTECLRTLELSELFLKVEMGQPLMNHRFPLLGDPMSLHPQRLSELGPSVSACENASLGVYWWFVPFAHLVKLNEGPASWLSPCGLSWFVQKRNCERTL